jgi:membrane-bound lytic murein transglycosylase B
MRSFFVLPALSMLFFVAQPCAQPNADERAQFVAEVVREHGVAAEHVGATLDGARFQQSIIDAMTRPAEAKPWKAYRPIFITAKRISDGREFMREHRDALARVEADTGVPAEMIAAIIGVETSYGRVTGSYLPKGVSRRSARESGRPCRA